MSRRPRLSGARLASRWAASVRCAAIAITAIAGCSALPGAIARAQDLLITPGAYTDPNQCGDLIRQNSDRIRQASFDANECVRRSPDQSWRMMGRKGCATWGPDECASFVDRCQQIQAEGEQEYQRCLAQVEAHRQQQQSDEERLRPLPGLLGSKSDELASQLARIQLESLADDNPALATLNRVDSIANSNSARIGLDAAGIEPLDPWERAAIGADESVEQLEAAGVFGELQAEFVRHSLEQIIEINKQAVMMFEEQMAAFDESVAGRDKLDALIDTLKRDIAAQEQAYDALASGQDAAAGSIVVGDDWDTQMAAIADAIQEEYQRRGEATQTTLQALRAALAPAPTEEDDTRPARKDEVRKKSSPGESTNATAAEPDEPDWTESTDPVTAYGACDAPPPEVLGTDGREGCAQTSDFTWQEQTTGITLEEYCERELGGPVCCGMTEVRGTPAGPDYACWR